MPPFPPPPRATAPSAVAADLRRLTTFRWVYAALALNFLLPAASYVVDPALAAATMDEVNRLLGGGAWPEEAGQLWHMLAVGNVATLGVMCLMLLVDLERFYPALPALVFLKAFSALYSLALGLTEGLPGFLAVFVLDGSTTVAFVVFAVRAKRALDRLPPDQKPPPLWVYALLLRPGVVQARLREARRQGLVDEEPTLHQMGLGVLRMLHRVVFRSETVGTSRDPVRATWRAALLRYRGLRLPFLLVERAVAPFDLSGLLSSRERILRHLLAAHHDADQFVYDLELLRCHPGGLDALCARAASVVDGTHPRATWLRDLVVFDGYHEHLLAAAEAARAGTLPSSEDPDISLRAYLAWCAAQPQARREPTRPLHHAGTEVGASMLSAPG